MSEWQTASLGDVADMLTGYPFKSDQYTSDSSGIRLIRGDNIVQGSLRWDGVKRWPAFQAAAHATYELAPADIVLAMDRPWIEAGLKYATIREADCPALLVQRVTRLRGTDRVDGRYLSYVIGSAAFTRHVLAVQTGTAVPHISGGQIKAFEFALPAMDTQVAIAAVLSALDDKIELNRRMNETLEASARALFRDWFVDFGPTRAKAEGHPAYLAPDLWSVFPDHLGDDGVPDGWTVSTLAAVAKLNPEMWSVKDHPDSVSYVDLSNTKWGYIEKVEHYAWSDAPSRARRVLRTGDTIVGTVRPGNGSYAYVARPNLTGSTGFAVLRPDNESDRAIVWCVTTSSANIERLAHLADGGAYPAVRPEAVLGTEMVIPSSDAFSAFERLATPLLERTEANKIEALNIATTRDALLPKLMSGELRVRDAETLAA